MGAVQSSEKIKAENQNRPLNIFNSNRKTDVLKKKYELTLTPVITTNAELTGLIKQYSRKLEAITTKFEITDAKNLRNLRDNLNDFHNAIEEQFTNYDLILKKEDHSIVENLISLVQFLSAIKKKKFTLPNEQKILVNALNEKILEITTSLNPPQAGLS